jgi:ubiquitin C-terminal hydrolase
MNTKRLLYFEQSAFLKMRNRVCYRLVGAIVHTELTCGGHYTCYFLDHGQEQWFHANDSKVVSNGGVTEC